MRDAEERRVAIDSASNPCIVWKLNGLLHSEHMNAIVALMRVLKILVVDKSTTVEWIINLADCVIALVALHSIVSWEFRSMWNYYSSLP